MKKTGASEVAAVIPRLGAGEKTYVRRVGDDCLMPDAPAGTLLVLSQSDYDSQDGGDRALVEFNDGRPPMLAIASVTGSREEPVHLRPLRGGDVLEFDAVENVEFLHGMLTLAADVDAVAVQRESSGGVLHPDVTRSSPNEKSGSSEVACVDPQLGGDRIEQATAPTAA